MKGEDSMILIDENQVVEFHQILQYFHCKDPEYAGARLELLHQYYFDHKAMKLIDRFNIDSR